MSLWIVIFLGMILSIFVGILVGTDAVRTVIVLLVLCLSTAWLFLARERWWVLMPMASLLGGYFYFGYKIYAHEVALLGCVIPLALGRAVRSPGTIQRRSFDLPVAMYILSAYLVIHWAASNAYNRLEGGAGYGNVTRAYLNALWVMIFILLFRKYGSTRHLALAFFLCYLAAFFRVVVGLIIYFTNAFAYVPVINYVLPGSTHSRGDDLRASGLSLVSIALCYFLFKKGFSAKVFHLLILIGGFVALAFGAGRTSIVLGCAALLFAAALYRKVAPLFLAALLVFSLVVSINARPAMLDAFPFRVQRAFSILLLDKGEAGHYGKTEGSDEWHAELRVLGYQRWTQSFSTFLFGTGIRPYDNAIIEFIPGKTTNRDFLISSAKVGAYESGWWTVIGVTGTVGIILYAIILFYLLRKLFPILLREKVRDYNHGVVFLAVFGIVTWVVLGWTNGTFPSGEIMFGFLALFALEDKKRAADASAALTEPPIRPHPSQLTFARG